MHESTLTRRRRRAVHRRLAPVIALALLGAIGASQDFVAHAEMVPEPMKVGATDDAVAPHSLPAPGPAITDLRVGASSTVQPPSHSWPPTM